MVDYLGKPMQAWANTNANHVFVLLANNITLTAAARRRSDGVWVIKKVPPLFEHLLKSYYADMRRLGFQPRTEFTMNELRFKEK